MGGEVRLPHCLSYFSICRIWLLPWKRADHNSPLPPRLSDDIFSTKAKQQRKTSFSSSGHEGKIATPRPSGPKCLWWHLGGRPWPRDSPGQPGTAWPASRQQRGEPRVGSPAPPPGSAPPAPGSDTRVCPSSGKNLQASNPAFAVVCPPEPRSLVLESFRAGAIPGRGWRQRLPLPGHKGKKGDIYMYIF